MLLTGRIEDNQAAPLPQQMAGGLLEPLEPTVELRHIDPPYGVSALQGNQPGKPGVSYRADWIPGYGALGQRHTPDEMDIMEGGASLSRKGRGDEGAFTAQQVHQGLHLGPDIAPQAGIDFLVDHTRRQLLDGQPGSAHPGGGCGWGQMAGVGIDRQGRSGVFQTER